MKTIYLRHAQPGDSQAVIDFYAEHPHPFVYQRAEDVLRERVHSGVVMMIEDEDGKILATAISYPLITQDEAGNEVHRWSEIGSVRVALADTGLFRPLVSALVLQSWLFEPPEDRFVIEIAKTNTHSQHVFAKEGATLFTIPSELEKKVAATLAPGTAPLDVAWFQLGAEVMPVFAQHLLDAERSPVLINKKTGDEYQLDVSRSVIMTQFHPALEKLAECDYGDVQKPDLSKGLKQIKPS